jgi:hypothetical protein
VTPLSTPIIEELGLSLTPMQFGMLESNLFILKCNAKIKPDLWGVFIQHVCWPDEVSMPEDLFFGDMTENRHYKLLMKVVEEAYPY